MTASSQISAPEFLKFKGVINARDLGQYTTADGRRIADRTTIEADFDATNLVYAADVRKYSRRVRFWGGKEEELAVVKACLGANTENFIRTLDRIEKEYGCLLGYLKGPIGLSQQDIQTLRERYLGDSL